MNGWDLFTYCMVAVLAGGSIIIFAFFLKDLGGVIKGRRGPDDRS